MDTLVLCLYDYWYYVPTATDIFSLRDVPDMVAI